MIRRFIAGSSCQGRPIRAFEVRPEREPRRWLLLLGVVHGDEPQGRWLLRDALDRWRNTPPGGSVGLVAVPCLNPDGSAARTRVNARGVDLNRNLPTRDWKASFEQPCNNPGPYPASEPETRALLELLERYRFSAILSVHSMRRYQINCNGPAREWAGALADICGYPVTGDIGYPCPGSLGTYAGAERQIPTITLEVDRDARRPETLRVHAPVIAAAVAWWDTGTE